MAELAAEHAPLDLIWGADAIALELGRTRRATFHLLENGDIPARKVRGRWVASRGALRRHFEGEDSSHERG